MTKNHRMILHSAASQVSLIFSLYYNEIKLEVRDDA